METYPSIELLTLEQCEDVLCNGMSKDPQQVSEKLFDVSLVSKQCMESMAQDKDDKTKASELLQAVKTRIKPFPQKFEAFLEALNKIPQLQDECVKTVRIQFEENKGKFISSSLPQHCM